MNNGSPRFDGQNRYRLTLNDSPVRTDVLRFHGREALSEPFAWHIEFTTSQKHIPAEQVLMKYAAFSMRGGKRVYGILTRLERLSASAGQAHYRATLSSRLALLSHTRRCAVYQRISVPELVAQILHSHGLEKADAEFRLEQTYPPRELITQWRETDLQFVQRLLSEVGIFWRMEMDHARELDVAIFADSQVNYPFAVCLPYGEPSGLSDGAQESVWSARAWHSAVTGGAGSATESGSSIARLHHERNLNKSTRFHLFSNASPITPGQLLKPQGNVIAGLKQGVIITLATFHAARDSRLHVSLWAMPYSEDYCYRPAEIIRPKIYGTLPARIESQALNDAYAWLDEMGRYRVKMDFDRQHADRGCAYLWLRMARPYAGDAYGWHTPLTDGTEVAVAFSHGDIDLPYIAYGLHDSDHSDHVNRDNPSHNVLKTPANNILLMEDKRGDEHIKLATASGKTELNTGHLVDGQGKYRGAGAELRTDEWGVVRAAKGLLVSADDQVKAQGEMRDMSAALKQIDLLQQQLQQLGVAAEQAQALKADNDSRIQMLALRLEALNEMVFFSAPEGMAFASAEDMQLAAGSSVAVSAGGDLSIGVMGRMVAHAGERLELFARTGQLSVKSSQGPVAVQSQNGSLRLFAAKMLTLRSVNTIQFAGKKRITLIGGGSYMSLEPGKVEYGTSGTYLRKVKRTVTAAGNPMPLTVPPLPGKQG